jgi:hypothetical protein
LVAGLETTLPSVSYLRIRTFIVPPTRICHEQYLYPVDISTIVYSKKIFFYFFLNLSCSSNITVALSLGWCFNMPPLDIGDTMKSKKQFKNVKVSLELIVPKSANLPRSIQCDYLYSQAYFALMREQLIDPALKEAEAILGMAHQQVLFELEEDQKDQHDRQQPEHP